MRKKLVALMLAGAMAFSMAACSGSDEAEPAAEETQVEKAQTEDMDTAKKEVAEEPKEEVTEEPVEEAVPEESEDVQAINSFVGQPLQGLIDKLSEIGYTGTYLADGVDFTSFIDSMAADYSVGSVEINEADKTVTANIVLTSNLEAAGAEDTLSAKLDTGASWTAVEDYGEVQYPYGFELHYLMGKIAEEAYDENTWFLKAECTVTNESGAKVEGTCEAKVTGTTDAPQVTEFTVY